MKLAITGCNGSVGRRVVLLALSRGHDVVGIDRVSNSELPNAAGFTFVQANLDNYEETLKALSGSEAVVHLAAHRDPGDYAVRTHNNNVVTSWNVLRACAEVSSSSVYFNVMTLVYSQNQIYHYFPLDEDHACLPDEPYGLSKVIAETQAAAICRRYPSMRVASLRFHYSVPNRGFLMNPAEPYARKGDLWGYVQEDSVADAFLLAIKANPERWNSGHEAFIIAAPENASDIDTMELKAKFFPDVPIKEGRYLRGRASFFDSSKAERILGWKHKDVDG